MLPALRDPSQTIQPIPVVIATVLATKHAGTITPCLMFDSYDPSDIITDRTAVKILWVDFTKPLPKRNKGRS